MMPKEIIELMARSAFPSDEEQMDALIEMLTDRPEEAFLIMMESAYDALVSAKIVKEHKG